MQNSESSNRNEATTNTTTINRKRSRSTGSRSFEDIVNWRLDPIESFSDCTIEIHVKDVDDKMLHVFDRPTKSNSSATSKFVPTRVYTYHVHRSMIGYGPKRSMYFLKDFTKKREQPINCNNTDKSKDVDSDKIHKLYFAADIAKTFPIVLDFIYSFDTNPDGTKRNLISRNNIVALNFIAKVLQISSLRKETESYFDSDLHVANCYTYFLQAQAVNGQKMVKVITTTILNNLHQIKLQYDIITDINAIELWKHIVQSRYRTNTVKENVQLCTLVACFCKLHRSNITKDDFNILIDIRYMPLIYYEAVQSLLIVSKDLGITDSSKILNRFQIRCLDAYIKNWTIWVTSKNFHSSLSKLNIHEVNYIITAINRSLDFDNNNNINNSDEYYVLSQSIRNHQSMLLSGAESLPENEVKPSSSSSLSFPSNITTTQYYTTIDGTETNFPLHNSIGDIAAPYSSVRESAVTDMSQLLDYCIYPPYNGNDIVQPVQYSQQYAVAEEKAMYTSYTNGL